MYQDYFFEAIYAVDANDGLSKDGVIPWRSKKDMQFFVNQTKHHIVVMGKNTYFSLPQRPLKDRINIVLTSKPEMFESTDQVIFTNDFIHVIQDMERNNETKKKIFIIGGKSVYQQWLPLCAVVWVTRLKKEYKCDQTMTVLFDDDGELVDEDDELVIRKYILKKTISF